MNNLQGTDFDLDALEIERFTIDESEEMDVVSFSPVTRTCFKTCTCPGFCTAPELTD